MARFRAAAPGGRSLEMPLLIVGVAALGFNLRGPITSLPPVYPELQSQLGLSTATVSLLAATPVICFGVVSAFAAWLSRRLGEERVLLTAAGALTCGAAAARAVARGDAVSRDGAGVERDRGDERAAVQPE
jgi:CP family cyanate transporter-like MFS transporter